MLVSSQKDHLREGLYAIPSGYYTNIWITDHYQSFQDLKDYDDQAIVELTVTHDYYDEEHQCDCEEECNCLLPKVKVEYFSSNPEGEIFYFDELFLQRHFYISVKSIRNKLIDLWMENNLDSWETVLSGIFSGKGIILKIMVEAMVEEMSKASFLDSSTWGKQKIKLTTSATSSSSTSTIKTPQRNNTAKGSFRQTVKPFISRIDKKSLVSFVDKDYESKEYLSLLRWGLRNQIPRISNETASHMNDYSGPYAYALNKNIRTNSKAMMEMLKPTIEGLDKGFQEAPPLPRDIEVLRIYKMPKEEKLFGLENDPSKLVGKTVLEKGFASCRAGSVLSGKNDVVMHLSIPKGSKVLLMDIVNQSHFRGKDTTSVGELDFFENEILLPRGCNYRITKHEIGEDGQHKIWAELVAITPETLVYTSQTNLKQKWLRYKEEGVFDKPVEGASLVNI